MRFLRVLKGLLGRIASQELGGRAAQSAYFSLAAVLPALMIIVAAVGALDFWDNGPWLETLMGMGLPDQLSQPLISEIENLTAGPVGSKIAVSLMIGLYLAARAVDAILRGVNAAWGLRDERPWRHQKLRVLLLTVVILGGVLGMIGMLSMESRVREWLYAQGAISRQLSTLVLWMRWPTVLLLLHQMIWAVFRFGAARRLGRRWVSFGSLFSTGGLLLVMAGFRHYVTQVTDLGATYGSLGTAMGLAFFCYFCSFVVLIGAALDCELSTRS